MPEGGVSPDNTIHWNDNWDDDDDIDDDGGGYSDGGYSDENDVMYNDDDDDDNDNDNSVNYCIACNLQSSTTHLMFAWWIER